MVVCVRGRQVHAEWGWLAAGGASELDWWLYAASWSLSPTLSLHNGHLGTHQKHKHTSETSARVHCTTKYSLHTCKHTQSYSYKGAHRQCIEYMTPEWSVNIHYKIFACNYTFAHMERHTQANTPGQGSICAQRQPWEVDGSIFLCQPPGEQYIHYIWHPNKNQTQASVV